MFLPYTYRLYYSHDFDEHFWICCTILECIPSVIYLQSTTKGTYPTFYNDHNTLWLTAASLIGYQTEVVIRHGFQEGHLESFKRLQKRISPCEHWILFNDELYTQQFCLKRTYYYDTNHWSKIGLNFYSNAEKYFHF